MWYDFFISDNSDLTFIIVKMNPIRSKSKILWEPAGYWDPTQSICNSVRGSHQDVKGIKDKISDQPIS
jgi:hypothetical protein